MTLSKDDVKEWLKDIKKDREWLAEQCEVGKRTVDAWLSTNQSISSRAQLIITKLMAEAQSAQKDTLNTTSGTKPSTLIELDIATYKKVEQEALENAMTLSDYCSSLISWCCSQSDIEVRLKARLLAEKQTASKTQPTITYPSETDSVSALRVAENDNKA